MAESGSAGTKGQGHGNREQFDHFDRLGKVDQKNLDADKMKATDKEADVEELLATEDKTHTTSSEFHEGGYKADKLDIELDLYERSKTDIPPIEEIENDTADKPPPSTSEESEQIVSKLDPVDFAFQAQGIVTKATSSVEPQADPQLIITQPAPPIQESIPQESQEIEEPEQNIPVEEIPEPPTSPEPPEPPTEPPEPPTEPPTTPPEPPEPPIPPEPPENPDPDPENCDDHPIPEQQENGNYNIIPGAGLIITIDSLSSNAGFNNSFGHYFADANGNPISGQINFVNVKNTLGVGEEVTIQYESGDIPSGAVQLGFFLIPNGANLNQISDGDIVTFQDIGGIWTPFVNDTPVQGASTPAFFSDQNLNPDGIGHMSYTPDGELNWEDKFAGGDNDFNDATLNVTVQSSTDNNGRDDIIAGTSGNDDIQGGQGDDVIFGSDGDDTLRGGAANDILIGNKGDDHLLGGSGHDILKGGEGDDTLEGEACDDHLFGGKGDDKLLGGTGHDKLYGGVGSDILEGNEGNDQIEGGDGDDTIKGGIGDDVIDGGEGDDTIKGGIGDDVIDGGEGNDQIEGGDGDDTIKGGPGDDVIDGGEGDDQIEGGDGDDTIKGGIGDDVIDGGEGNDQIEGGDGDDTIKGGIGDDVIDGGEGNDQIEGGDGDDTIKGGIGDDVIDGGEGDDQIEGGDGDDTIKGGPGDDVIDGGEGNDQIEGGDGDDTIKGGIGDDLIDGGEGDDTIKGGIGDDVIDGGEGNDQIEGGDGDDTIKGGIGDDVIDGGDGNDQIEGGDGDDTIKGGIGDDVIEGGDGNDQIEGGDGDDTIKGGIGDDVIEGGDGNDQIEGGDGDDTIKGGIGDDVIDGGDGNDQIEGGDGDDTIKGGIGDDVIDGGEGNDQIEGGEGDDTIKGGLGDDVIEGGDGNDQIEGGDGDDTIKGGIGDDVIDGGDGNDQIEGGDGDDTIKGGIGDDVIDGGEGNDQIEGGEGDDTIKGGIGDDVIDGGEGNDQIEGGDGDDTIKGGKGKDILEGQAGNDLLIGGEGDDLLIGDRDTNHVPAPSQLQNGNYDISKGTGFSVTLDSITSTASLENSFGVYFMDNSGNPISGVVNFSNVQDTLGVGNPMTINFAADDIPAGAVQLGFFIIPDGHGLNPNLIDGDHVTFAQNGDGQWAAFLNGNELQGDQGSPAFFSDQHLNPDNLDHMTNSINQGQVQVGFEDLLGGGDNDFDDAVVNVTVEGFDPNREENNDTLLGGKGDDILKGGAGDDILEGNKGNDTLEGGTGNDIAIFQGAYNEYNITKNDDGSFTVEDKIANRDGTDIVDQVEIFQFSDRSIATSEIINTEPFLIEESSDFSGWSDNKTSTLNQDGIGEFLGRQGDSDGKQVLHKTFDISDAGNTITIEFDMLEIDDWESTGNSADDFVVFVNNQPVLTRQFDANVDDGEQNPDGLENLGFGHQNDEIHHIKLDFNINEDGSLTLLNPDGSESNTVIDALPNTSNLKLGFGADMTTGISNESWGIDNVKISSNLPSNSHNSEHFSNDEIVADDTDDWMEVISGDNNFTDNNPENWLEDINQESHEHSDSSDHSGELGENEENISDDDNSDDSELPPAN